MSGKLTVPYHDHDHVSTIMSIKTFEIPAETVPFINRNWYGQFLTHTKTTLLPQYSRWMLLCISSMVPHSPDAGLCARDTGSPKKRGAAKGSHVLTNSNVVSL